MHLVCSRPFRCALTWLRQDLAGEEKSEGRSGGECVYPDVPVTDFWVQGKSQLIPTINEQSFSKFGVGTKIEN